MSAVAPKKNVSRMTEPDAAPSLHKRVVTFLENLAKNQDVTAAKLREAAKDFAKLSIPDGVADRIDGAEYAELLAVGYRAGAEKIKALTPASKK